MFAEDATTGLRIGAAQSSSTGSYQIRGLPEGQYRVYTFDQFGLGYAIEYYDEATDAGSASPVSVVGTDTTEEIDFTLDSS